MSAPTRDRPTDHAGDPVPRQLIEVVERLVVEFGGVVPAGTVYRCVDAARGSARHLDGPASVAAVEAVARNDLIALTRRLG